ncbi:hypothetical protein PLICRDRAFT_179431 [Plicaturopsis crispa FD-325 SS-3]|uniref:ABM domain-containing protein n=1 Tax=Plicaturopsis crispa FD-325 SS-3 TaxID=944288 RepID=A0A0C9SL00_PLICR|nr:hypothetical protein PLICRDRAFT_179431 [Plicaturopsis crispa FD-325 SS-3]
MTVTEICTFSASDAYRTDQSIVKPFAQTLIGTPGFISLYHGLQVEDPTVGYIFIVWESFEAHKALIDSPAQGPILDTLKPLFAGQFTSVIHAKFTTDPTAALSAPTTEYLFTTPKEGSSKEALSEIFSKLALRDFPEVLGAADGPCIERDDTLVLVVGWESVEAHRALMKTAHPDKLKILGTLRAQGDSVVRHLKLSKV